MDVLGEMELSYSTEGGVESDSAVVRPLLEANSFKPSFVNSSLFGEQ